MTAAERQSEAAPAAGDVKCEVSGVSVREMAAADISALREFLNDEIENGHAVYYDRPRSVTQFFDWYHARRTAGWPLLVAERDGVVAGFGTYGLFRPWSGFRPTVEHMLVVGRAHRRRHIGMALLEALTGRARDEGRHSLIGVIDAEDDASLDLHAATGFREVGRLPEIGRRDGGWRTHVLMQRIL